MKEETMKTGRRIALSVLTGLAMVASSALADTLPPGAQPVSGNIESVGTLTPLPVTIPDGWVFVLTDFESPNSLQIFAANDPLHPRYRVGINMDSVGRSLQTGLVFNVPPLISAAGNWFSFSGYVVPAD
jgi:hypothetical protein